MQFIQESVLFLSNISKSRIKTICLYSSISVSAGIKKPKLNMDNKPQVIRRIDNILKSQEDKRSYRGLILSNHMKVLLVSDPTTDKSAAALDVNVGYMSDPKEVLGLAHFCEHMLFLGTKKFPNENDYSKFLSLNGGSSNAATYPDHTMYFFDIVPDKLAEALDRFSQFFIAPLFTESATDREINAVNSEHEKNISSDVWRKDQLDRHLANPDHPYHTFGTGNNTTLKIIPKEKNINIRDELLKFHDKWYSSNIMCLAVLGKENLDELEKIVLDLFNQVEDKCVEAPRWEEQPFKNEQFRTYVYMCPVKDVRNLNIVFPCPDLQKYYKSSHKFIEESYFRNGEKLADGQWSYSIHKFQEKFPNLPSHYISHLMGHEGPGSILSVLKARGWSNNLIAGSRPAPRGLGFFGLTVDLTEEGIKHVDDIIELIFQYIKMLKSKGPCEWVQNENKDIGNMLFRFKDKESPRVYISSLVHTLHDHAMEDVLSCSYLLSEWRPDIIQTLWKDFIPEKIRVLVVGKQFEPELDQVEPWYGTKYRIQEISDTTLKSWAQTELNPKLKMPDVNEFIPTDFHLYPIEKDQSNGTKEQTSNGFFQLFQLIKKIFTKNYSDRQRQFVEALNMFNLNTEHPIIIQDTALCRVWYKQDDVYRLPKVNAMFDFVSPLAYLDPLNCNLTHMFVQLFRDSLNEYTYAAELAGLKWELINTKYGLVLALGGYNNKQHIFLDKVMEKLTSFKVQPRRFEIFKEHYIRHLKNFAAEQPYQHAVYYLAVLLTEHSWTKQELLTSAENLTLDKLEAFIPQILSKMHIECLIHGNTNKEKALQLVQIVEDRLLSSLSMSPLLPRQLLLNRELELENGCNYVYEVENDIHKESCIELYFQCGLQSKESNMKLELFAQIIQEPCFDILRTKEQLGYIVFSGIRRSNGVLGLRIIIQSDRHPSYLDARIELFLEQMLTNITNMSESEFLKHREALAAQRLEKPKQLTTQSNIYWSEISAQQYHFDRANVEVAYLRTLSKQDIIHFFEEIIQANAGLRKKLSVYVVSMADGGAGRDVPPKEENDKGDVVNEASRIQDVTSFKSAHGMYPLVQPYISITRKGNKCKL